MYTDGQCSFLLFIISVNMLLYNVIALHKLDSITDIFCVGPKENDSVAIKMTPGNPVKLTCSTGKQCHIAYQMCLTVAAPMGFIPYAR